MLKCPECKHDVHGGRFWRTGVKGAMRECECGHIFPEPPRTRKPDKRIAALERTLAAQRTSLLALADEMERTGRQRDARRIREIIK